MKDFSAWRDAIQSANTLPALKSIGADLSQFQNQPNFAGVEAEPKLKPSQVEALRKIYSEKLKKLKSETL
jgi:hypothetical protein